MLSDPSTILLSQDNGTAYLSNGHGTTVACKFHQLIHTEGVGREQFFIDLLGLLLSEMHHHQGLFLWVKQLCHGWLFSGKGTHCVTFSIEQIHKKSQYIKNKNRVNDTAFQAADYSCSLSQSEHQK